MDNLASSSTSQTLDDNVQKQVNHELNTADMNISTAASSTTSSTAASESPLASSEDDTFSSAIKNAIQKYCPVLWKIPQANNEDPSVLSEVPVEVSFGQVSDDNDTADKIVVPDPAIGTLPWAKTIGNVSPTPSNGATDVINEKAAHVAISSTTQDLTNNNFGKTPLVTSLVASSTSAVVGTFKNCSVRAINKSPATISTSNGAATTATVTEGLSGTIAATQAPAANDR